MKSLEILSDRLRLCRNEKGKTQKEMAGILNISDRAYQHYELNDREPPTSKLIVLADFFDVSLDYLIGRTDNRDSHK
jgi:transcriptional regulator with XRE-family HTH domain